MPTPINPKENKERLPIIDLIIFKIYKIEGEMLRNSTRLDKYMTNSNKEQY